MRTVRITLDDELVDLVDKAADDLKTTRSAFTRAALREALDRLNMKALEEEHRQGYTRHPPKADEFSVWKKTE